MDTQEHLSTSESGALENHGEQGLLSDNFVQSVLSNVLTQLANVCLAGGRESMITTRETENCKMFKNRQLDDLNPWSQIEKSLHTFEMEDIKSRIDKNTERTPKIMKYI